MINFAIKAWASGLPASLHSPMDGIPETGFDGQAPVVCRR